VLDSIIPLRGLSRKAPRLYLPENLPDYFDERSQMVVSSLYLRKHIFKDRNPDRYWSVSSDWLISMVGKLHRRRVLDGLIGNGVIECDGIAERGVKCYGYRLTYEHQNAHWQSRLLRHPELIRNVENRRLANFRSITHPVHQTLVEHLRDRAELVGYPGVLDVPAQCLVDREIFFRVDPHTGRVYSGYANLPNVYRQYVNLDGKPAYAVDIRNSQPTLLAYALLEWMGGISEREVGSRKGRENPNKTPEHGNRWYSCLNDFKDCCLSGTIYEVLRDRANAIAATRRRPTVYDRDRVKGRFFGSFFGLPCDQASSAVGQAFRSLWPVSYEVLARWKVAAHEGGHPVPWGAPAIAAQRIEAEIVVEGAAARFLTEFPQAPCLTQHDCIITTADYVGEAQRILVREFRERYGATVPTKVSLWYDEERAARWLAEKAAEKDKPVRKPQPRKSGELTQRELLRSRFDRWAASRTWE
jgi:hypothetical protein